VFKTFQPFEFANFWIIYLMWTVRSLISLCFYVFMGFEPATED